MAASVTSNVTSGFFDSTESDRRIYTADEFSSIFDGLISDGVYENYPGGTRTVNGQAVKIPPFEVTKVTSGNDLVVTVGPGRAWFHHVWVLNTTSTVTLSAAHGTLPRVDSIYLRVNKSSRSCALVCAEGTPSSDKTPGTIPSDDNNNGIYYYPIAFVEVPKAAASSSSLIVTSAIGNPNPPANGRTPIVKAIVDPSMTLADYLASYQAQVTAQLEAKFAEIDAWKDTISALVDADDCRTLIVSTSQRVDGHDTNISTINDNIQTLSNDNASLHLADTATNTNVSTLLGYFDTGLPVYAGTSYNINSVPKTFCRIRDTCKGTMPKGLGGNQYSVYTQVPGTQTNPAYNVQVAVGFGADKIAIRRRSGGNWTSWKYVDLK